MELKKEAHARADVQPEAFHDIGDRGATTQDIARRVFPELKAQLLK